MDRGGDAAGRAGDRGEEVTDAFGALRLPATHESGVGDVGDEAPAPDAVPTLPASTPTLRGAPPIVADMRVDESPPAVPDESSASPDHGSDDPVEAAVLPADATATRNVPRTHVARDIGLPTAPAGASTATRFDRPELEPMGEATTALLVGRGLLALAALLVGIAARRATGGSPDGFWPVVVAAGVIAAVGVAGVVYWTATLADNARRLRARTATPRSMIIVWLLPVAWVAVSCLTYLQVDVDGDLDPLPGVAALGWLITVTIAHARLQGVFRGLSRTPPIVWLSVFPIDVLALGALWWRLTGWPSPVGSDLDGAQFTANVAFGVAAALLLNGLLYVWLAQQASNGIYERLGRLEAQHRPAGTEPSPAWFQSGFGGAQQFAPPVVKRPLIGTRRLAAVVSVLHVMWGLSLFAFGVVLGLLAFEYSDLPVFLAGELVVDDDDLTRLTVVGGIVGLATFGAVVTHGVWAVLSATNGRRVTVHSPNPGTFAIAFAPMPLLVVGGLVIGGTVGYWMVLIGLSTAFFASIFVNQLLMALSARLGGRLDGFGRWSSCLALTYLAGVVVNVLFARATAQLGLYATLSILQGALVAAGGVIGLRAMRGLEQTLVEHRQVARV